MAEFSLSLSGHGQVVSAMKFTFSPLSLASEDLEDRLRQSASAVAARHPLLRSTVSADHTGAVLCDSLPPLPVSVAAPDGIAAIVEKELNEPLNLVGGLLWRLTLVPPPPVASPSAVITASPSTVVAASPQLILHAVLSLSHAVADGISAVAVLGEFVEAFLRPSPSTDGGGSAAGGYEERHSCESRISPSPDAAAAAAKGASEWARRTGARQWPASPPASRSARCILRLAEIPPSLSSRALTTCRAQKTTINAALVAALAIAAREIACAGEDTAAPIPLCVNVCVDLRKRCSPPFPAGELGCMFEAVTSLHTLPVVTSSTERGETGDLVALSTAANTSSSSSSSSAPSSSASRSAPPPSSLSTTPDSVSPRTFWDLARDSRAQVDAFLSQRCFGGPLTYTDADVAGALSFANAVTDKTVPSPYTIYLSNIGVQPTPPEAEAVFYCSTQRTGICGIAPSIATTPAGTLSIASSLVDEEIWGRVFDRMVGLFMEHCIF